MDLDFFIPSSILFCFYFSYVMFRSIISIFQYYIPIFIYFYLSLFFILIFLYMFVSFSFGFYPDYMIYL